MLFSPGKSCEICGDPNSTLTECSMCGAHVCKDDVLEEERVCLVCMEARCYICEEYLASRACDVCGRLVCEDHGIKEGEATICDNCRADD
ncbi:MAG: hypothetical protein KGY80_08975 [Candidatus Thorarchaeota archaeon]|nr:hypothetical protein [Candidatus Thorarchaeota archaeon]